MTTKEIIAAFEAAARANFQDSCRHGNIITVSAPGDVIMTGDLHGHERNFEKLVRFAQLDQHHHRHLILHEILHNTLAPGHECHSYILLAQAALLKSRFPDQVHILMGNHDMAQVTRDEVLKNGQPMVRSLTAGLVASFGDKTDLVIHALDAFLLSLPIAARAENRIWMSHSLPSARHLHDFDDEIFNLPLTLIELKQNPHLHALLWDRNHDEKCLQKLQTRWNVDHFIVGHQPQAQGYHRPHRYLTILACDHPHGHFLLFDLHRPYLPDDLFSQIKPLASIA